MSPTYMLDTDHVSYALRGYGKVGRALLARRPSQICVSAISVAELRYGADRRASRRLHDLINAFTRDIEIAPFDGLAALAFGRLAAALATRGAPIGQLDTLIAAHSVALGTTLVTNNLKHFSRVGGLKLDNWV